MAQGVLPFKYEEEKRFSFINIPGRIVEGSPEFIIRLVTGHPAVDLLLEGRRRNTMLVPAPSG